MQSIEGDGYCDCSVERKVGLEAGVSALPVSTANVQMSLSKLACVRMGVGAGVRACGRAGVRACGRAGVRAVREMRTCQA